MTNDTITNGASSLNNNLSVCVRFTKSQVRAMDRAVKKGDFMNRSEAIRTAVRLLFDKDHCTLARKA